MSDAPDLKKIRTRLGLTQAQLAERMGVDRSSVTHFEKGRAIRGPTLKVVQALALEAAALPEPAADPTPEPAL